MVLAASLWVLTAHLLADFPLQPDRMSTQKVERPIVRLAHVAIHVIVTFPVAIALYGASNPAFVFLLWIGVSHFVIDSRRWVEPKEHFPTYHWVVDQVLHLCALSLAFPIAGLVI